MAKEEKEEVKVSSGLRELANSHWSLKLGVLVMVFIITIGIGSVIIMHWAIGKNADDFKREEKKRAAVELKVKKLKNQLK